MTFIIYVCSVTNEGRYSDQGLLSHLSPGLQHSQFLHRRGTLTVQLTGRTFPSLHLVKRRHKQVVDSPQVIEVTDYAATNPRTTHLKSHSEVKIIKGKFDSTCTAPMALQL